MKIKFAIYIFKKISQSFIYQPLNFIPTGIPNSYYFVKIKKI